MSDFNNSMKVLNLGILGLSIYTAVETVEKMKIDEIESKETVTISKSYILGACISLAVLSAINFALLHYVYDYTTGSNITYKIFGLVITGAIILLGGFLLAEFLEINHLKGKKPTIYTDERIGDTITTVGLVLGGLTIGTGFFMIMQILLIWGSSISKPMKKKIRKK
jgi:uncharacterized membrane protein